LPVSSCVPPEFFTAPRALRSWFSIVYQKPPIYLAYSIFLLQKEVFDNIKKELISVVACFVIRYNEPIKKPLKTGRCSV